MTSVGRNVLVLLMLASCMSGFVVVDPNSSTFASDVSEWNGANQTTSMPARIYFVYSAQDTAVAMKNALALGLKLIVRSGRHQYTGLRLTEQQQHADGTPHNSSATPFAVIDVSNITEMYWSSGDVKSVATVGAGVRQFQVYEDAARRGYLLPGGTCPTVGISGFTLGGGYGFFGRKYSIAADSLVGAEIVMPPLAAGGSPRIVNVSRENSQFDDVMWALQGGGNNVVGVVTALRYQLPTIPSAPSEPPQDLRPGGGSTLRGSAPVQANFTHVRLSIGNISDCWRFAMPLYDTIAPNAPPELYCQFLVYETSCGVYAVMEGNASLLNATFRLQQWLDTVPSAVIQGDVLTVSYNDFVISLAGCGTMNQCMNRTRGTQPDPNHPTFFGAFSLYVDKALGNEGLEALYQQISLKPPSLGFLFSEFDPYGPSGAVNHKSANETAFPHRSSLYHIQFMVYWSTANATAAAHQWLSSSFQSIATHGAGSYRNYPSVWLPNPGQRFYKGNLERLQSIKREFDPEAVFLTEVL